MNKEEIALNALLGQFRHDSKFKVVVDDPERDLWDVIETHYVDADRAGYCGYMDDGVVEGLGQSDAVWLACRLNELAEQRRVAWKARFTNA